MKPISIKIFSDRIPSRLSILFSLVALLIVCIFILVITFSSRRNGVEIRITETNFAAKFFYKDSLRPVINKYETAFVKGDPTLKIEKASFIMILLAPSYEYIPDPLLLILLIAICIICLVYLWNFYFSNPLSGKLSKTVKGISIVLLIFWLMNFLRSYWLNNQIMTITHHQYKYTFEIPGLLFKRIEFYIGLIFYRLSQLIKYAEIIKQEQALTI